MSKRVLKLHTELAMDGIDANELSMLKKHGFVNQNISRDILIPEDMTLHALHYALNRLYGWQNSHLHHFELPESVFDSLTRNRFMTWKNLCGVYFRYPHEDYDDLYWDDDADETASVNTWLRKKYTGPYRYLGNTEHALVAKEMANELMSKSPVLRVMRFISEAPYEVDIKKASLEDLKFAFMDFRSNELLERLKVSDVLYGTNDEHKEFHEIREDIYEWYMDINIDDKYEKYKYSYFPSRTKEMRYLEQFNCPVSPVSNELVYYYDYGDGWKVKIRFDDWFELDDEGSWDSTDFDENQLNTVMSKRRPVCIAADGLSLLDDVGGIHGYCDMLRSIYEYRLADMGSVEERFRTTVWAKSMGWTGKMKALDKML